MNFKIIHTTYKKIFEKDIKDGFVACGDIHLSNNHPYGTYDKNGFSSRLADSARALHKVGSVAEHFLLPVILNGDIITARTLDYHVEAVFTNFLKDFLAVPIYINLGNHDMDGSVSVITPLLKYGNNNLHSTYKHASIEHGYGLTFYFLPFMDPNDSEKAIDGLIKNFSKYDLGKYRILFVHNQFANAYYPNKIKSASGINQAKISKHFDLIVASHIHKYQEICNGKGFYTSSLIPLDFGERGKQHGFHVVDMDAKVRYFVRTDAPQFVYVKASQLDEQKTLRKAKGNIVCVKEDIETNKAKIIRFLTEHKARFVTFKKPKKKSATKIKSSSKNKKIQTSDVDSIVVVYSKTLAKNHSLDDKATEELGLDILDEAKRKLQGG